MKYRNLKEKAYLIIKDKIITCELMPGEIINEKELIEEIESSRTPIREALNKLENENLINIYPKRGIFVTDITAKDVFDIFNVRKLIEPFAARIAAPNIKIEDLEYFQEIYLSEQTFSLSEYLNVARDFHLLIFRATRNLFLKTIAINMYEQGSRIRYLLRIVDKQRGKSAHREHLDLIKAFMERDEEKAAEVMRTHLEILEKSSTQILNRLNYDLDIKNNY